MSATPSAEEYFHKNLRALRANCSQVFYWLLWGQWLGAILLELAISPFTWQGTQRSLHPHVLEALLLGGVVNLLPLLLLRLRPEAASTRQAVAVAQVLWSALLIHITGGRVETHFHVFGSLAFLAFYRDWRLLATATLVVAADHLVRGMFWPESVYGIANPEWWRFLEHAAWMAFEDVVLVLGIQRSLAEMRVVASREAALAQLNAEIECKVQERTQELADSMQRYRTLVETSNAIPWEYDVEAQRMRYIAPQAQQFFSCAEGDLYAPGFLASMIHPGDAERVSAQLRRALELGERAGEPFDCRVQTGDDRLLDVRVVLSPCQPGQPLRGVLLDVTRQKQLEAELNQAQKLESVGRLAAGIAHEINTPLQFVGDSVYFLRDATRELLEALAKFRTTPSAMETRQEDDADVDYLEEHMPRACERALEGLERVSGIVRSMKEFAHPDSSNMAAADINRAILSTLTIARNEYKYVAEVETRLETLPSVYCHVGDINQAVLNIVVNAAHAIEEANLASGARGVISVCTRQDGEAVEIAISDTGIGIPEHIRHRIFDPFFTTKELGRGTGQGLAIARAVIVDKHGGSIRVDSKPGAGSTFTLRLPVDGRGAALKAVA